MFWRHIPPIQSSILAFVLALLFLSHLHGQQMPASDLERLQAELRSAPRGERASKMLGVLSRFDLPAGFRRGVADELIEESSEEGDALILGRAYCGKATAMMHAGELEPALEFFQLAEEHGLRCTDRDPAVFFKSRCNHAACLTVLGDTEKSARLLVDVLDFAEGYGDLLDVPFVYTMMSHHAEKVGAIDMALKYLQKAFDESVRTGKKSLAAQAGTTIVGMLAINDQNQEAEQWISKVEPWIADVEDPAIQLGFELHREDVRIATGDSMTAVENLKKIVARAQSLGNRQLWGNALLSISAAETSANNFDAAIESADKAIEVLSSFSRSQSLAKHHRLNAMFFKGMFDEALKGTEEVLAGDDDSYPRWKTFELRSRIFAKLGRHEEALAELMKSREAEQQRLTIRAREQANYMSVLFDNEQRIGELALAKESQKAAELRSELSELNARRQSELASEERVLRNFVLGLAVVALIIGIFWARSAANRRAAMAVAAREQQLNQELSERLAKREAELREEVSSRRQLELSLERKHRDETIGKLTGGVAHDFNNLLTVIIQSIELTKMLAGPLPKEVIQLLDSSLNAAESGASIVKQLLSFARQQPLSPEPIEVSKWLASSSSLFRQIVGKVVEYRETELADGASICVDSARLTTAIINLLANARDAIDPVSGKIELKITSCAIDEKEASAWTEIVPGEYVLFQVFDNGRGMSPEELRRACEPFYSTKSPSAGTGLGLSSVLGFVRQSGGDLQLKSTEESGTSVSFLLPKILDSAEQFGTQSKIGFNKALRKILLVEDQEQVRMVIGVCLKSMGLDVVEAANAEQAMQLIDNTPNLDWVLSDIRMPGAMDGVQLRKWILEKHPNVQVILMSGYRDLQSEVEEDAIFLQKPIKPAELRHVLGVA